MTQHADIEHSTFNAYKASVIFKMRETKPEFSGPTLQRILDIHDELHPYDVLDVIETVAHYLIATKDDQAKP